MCDILSYGNRFCEVIFIYTQQTRQIHIFSEKSRYKCEQYENPNQKYIYIIFSATPYKVAKMIRVVTHNPYSHVSFSFNGDLSKMYSFARYYKQTPFYGGFITEYPTRFKLNGKTSNVKICAIPVDDEKIGLLYNYIKNVKSGSEEYLYNMISAAFTPVHKKIKIEKSYTCIEFVIHILSLIDKEINEERFYTIRELEQHLERYVVYEGVFPNESASELDTFENKQSFTYGLYHSVKLIGVLLRRKIHNEEQ